MTCKLRCFVSVLVLVISGCTQPRATKGSKAASSSPTAAAPKPAASAKAVLPGSLLAGAHRVVFLGDSITHSGQYVDDISMVVRHLAGEDAFEFINLGLPSETVSGLSEPGHAHDSFPRPNLH